MRAIRAEDFKLSHKKLPALDFVHLKDKHLCLSPRIISTTCYTPVGFGVGKQLCYLIKPEMFSYHGFSYITLGILARNLCPPESLESVSLHPGSDWNASNRCSSYCLHVFRAPIRNYLYGVAVWAPMSPCLPPCFPHRDVFFLCVCVHMWACSRYLTKPRCLLYYQH